MKRIRLHRLLKWLLVGLVLLVILGVWVSQQFPALTSGPKSSTEILASVFKMPARRAGDLSGQLAKHVEREALELFIRSCDLPADSRQRLLSLVRGESFREVTVPFVYYLYETYGRGAAGPVDDGDLAYAEPSEAQDDPKADRPGLSALVRNSSAVRKHVSVALRAFDALFLQVKPGAIEQGLPLHQRYDAASYERIKALVRELADEYLGPADDSAGRQSEKDQYQAMLREIVGDEQRLSALVEFFTDFIRQLSDSWLESFAERQHRKEARLAWVEDCLNGNRLYEIADYARSRSERRLVVHVVVDGLQGKLLEGLAQLSSGDRRGPGAAYVEELVRIHQSHQMDPASYRSRMPPGLGRDVVELVRKAPNRPEYLENFKQYVFGPQAQAVVVNVATVDTPTISVRNLPVVQTGHAVPGRFGTGIPNFSYIDRRTGRGWYFWGSDALHLGRIFHNREDEIPQAQKRDGPGAQTLFERLWRYNTVSCMASVDAGALEKLAAEVGLAVGTLKRNYMEKVLVASLRRRAEMEKMLNERRMWLGEHRNLSHSFLGALLFDAADLKKFHEHARFLAEHEDEGLPDVLLWYNPWPDHFAHGEGPFSDALVGYQGEFDRLDFYLGRVIGVYESLQTADGQSTYAARTLFGLVSDHGMAYTPQQVSTDKLLFQAMHEGGIKIKYQKLTADEGELPVIRGRNDALPTRPFDAVVGSTAGGSYVIDLFDAEGLRGNDAAWQRHPDYHQLRRYRLLSGQTIDWIEQLKTRLSGAMDLAVVREYGPSADQRWPPDVQSVVRIITPDRGEARIWRVGTPAARRGRTVRYRYEPIGGKDPLDLAGSVRDYLMPQDGPSVAEAREAIRRRIDAREGCDDDSWREVLSYTLRPDVVYQLSHLYDTDRAGTINVFPARHVGMNSGVAGRHAGETFEEKNGTQVYFGAGLKRGSLQTARNGSLPVTLYHWLVGDECFHARDAEAGASPAEQFGFASLLHEPVFESIRQQGSLPAQRPRDDRASDAWEP